MVDSYNLQASADIRVTAVILIIVTLMNLTSMAKSLRHMKYQAAQLMLVSIYMMPIVIGWVAWVQLMNTSELRSIWFTQSFMKAVCIACFVAYIQRMIGWTVVNGENVYTKERLYQNLVTGKAPVCICKCFKIRVIDTVDTARWYIERVRSLVYQLCAVFVSSSLIGIIYSISTNDPKLDSKAGSKLFLILSGATSVSSIVALNALVNLGMYANTLPVTKDLKILHKFIVIKLGLLFTEFQPLVVAIFAYTGTIASLDRFSEEEIMLYTNSLLVVSEMIIMSFLIQETFPLSDYDVSAEYRKSLAIAQDSLNDSFTNM